MKKRLLMAMVAILLFSCTSEDNEEVSNPGENGMMFFRLSSTENSSSGQSSSQGAYGYTFSINSDTANSSIMPVSSGDTIRMWTTQGFHDDRINWKVWAGGNQEVDLHTGAFRPEPLPFTPGSYNFVDVQTGLPYTIIP